MSTWINGEVGECPHCAVRVRFENAYYTYAMNSQNHHSPMNDSYNILNKEDEVYIELYCASCPDCGELIVSVGSDEFGELKLLWPKSLNRKPLHAAVPSSLSKDYWESVCVLPHSPNASAALARRCLQTLLVNQGAKKRNLADQISEIYNDFPSYVQTYVDKIRELGNIAAHAKQGIHASEIVDVEPQEADWILGLLEELFDHFYAKPAESKKKQQLVEEKLKSMKRLTPQEKQNVSQTT